jgi:phosphohistidine phosphatase
MELILWRHADAEYSLPDLERELTAKGLRQARGMAELLAPRLPRTARILVSPAVRARQTAAALGLPVQIEPALAPEATVAALLQAAGWPQAEGCVVVVGHQPTLGRAAARLLTGCDTDLSLRKGAVWWLSGREREGMDATAFLRFAVGPEFSE